MFKVPTRREAAPTAQTIPTIRFERARTGATHILKENTKRKNTATRAINVV